MTNDLDCDGLPTSWESQFGLDPNAATGPNGSSGDADGDGLTNAQELAAGTHPRGFVTRYLAEGAANAFFDARLALLNTGTEPARVLLRFLHPGGAVTPLFQLLAGGRRGTVDPETLTGPTSPDFATVVESDVPLIVDRTMSWDAGGYGAHAETSVGSAATTWYLAEGSTSGNFALFYLLQNPNASAVTATIRYLLPFGPPVVSSVPASAEFAHHDPRGQ